jgi:hypothetical protein
MLIFDAIQKNEESGTTEKVSLHDFKCEPPGTSGAEPP